MGRNKLERFRENAESENVIEPGKAIYEHIKGKWHALHFKNNNPIVLELACGNGEYSTQLAKLFPYKNFIGVDIKGARIWRGSVNAKSDNIENVAFLRTKIQLIQHFFVENEVDEIWIIFPDPRPKDSDERRRLTHPRFLEIYKNIMKRDRWIHLKTDNSMLFEYSLEQIKERSDINSLTYTWDLYHSEFQKDHFGIRTRYEQMFSEEGHDIKYLKFKFS